MLAAVDAAAGESEIDAATRDAIFAMATRDYGDPAGATMRNVHKSRARNGMGYCGEVTLAEGEGYTVFHVLRGGGSAPTVLRLSEFPESDVSSNAVTVRQMMKNFGCTD
jgi:hypothetical protein